MNGKISIGLCLALSLTAWLGCESTPTTLMVTSSTGGDGGESSSTTDGSGGSTSSTTVTTGTGATGAKAYFLATVYPLLATHANTVDPAGRECGSCHLDPGSNGAPVWLLPDADSSYTSVTAFPGLLAAPSNSLLILQGEHAGPAIDPEQDTAIRAWLDMEVIERGLDTGEGTGGSTGTGSTGCAPVNLEDALEAYGACMDYDMWNANGLYMLADMMTDQNNTTCNGCHASGLGGNYLRSSDDLLTFEMNQMFPYVQKMVTGTVDTDGSFAGLIASKRWIDKDSVYVGWHW